MAAIPAGAATVLAGRSSLASQVDSNPAGNAEAFPYVAIASGDANVLEVYVDSSSTAANVELGIYTSTGSGHPGTLITSASSSSVTAGAWNALAISGAGITQGATYWLAMLSTSGTLAFLDDTAGGLKTDQSEVDGKSNLHSLPATWTPGTTFNSDQASLFAGIS